jgi:hypothetical protein
MKKLIVLIVLLLCGCQNEGYYTQLTDTVNQSIDAQQNATKLIIEAVEGNTEEVDGVFEKIDILQEAAKEAAKEYDARQDDVQGIIDAAIAANTASAPINPYAPIIASVLAALGGGYGAFRHNSERKTAAKYKSHKQGVEKFNREHEPGLAEEIYGNIAEARKINRVSS